MAGSIYKNFPISGSEIRILVLHHGQRSDPIACDLTTTSLVLEKTVEDYWPEFVRFGATLGISVDDHAAGSVEKAERSKIDGEERKCTQDGEESHKSEGIDKRGGQRDENKTKNRYEALSYTWGDVTVTTPIYVCGTEFQVTLNLKSALEDLRCTEVDRSLWVDAICINQNDLRERSQQVQMMTRIYREAEGVLAWLGPGFPSIEKAFSIFENVAINKQLHNDASNSEGNQPSNSQVEFTKSWAMSLLSVFDSPWWTRVWTYQEALAGIRLDLVFGCCSIEAHKFYEGLLEHDRHRQEKCCQHPFNDIDGHEAKLVRIFDLISDRFGYRGWISQDLGVLTHQLSKKVNSQEATRKSENNSEKRMLELMVAHQHRECSDLRDKVYGFIGLGTGLDSALLDADYTLEVHDVYISFAFTHIILSQSLDILSTHIGSPSGILPKSAIFPRSEEFPKGVTRTWVTDWSISFENFLIRGIPINRLRELERSNASQSNCTDAHLVGDCTLVVEGHVVDHIVMIVKKQSLTDFSYWESFLGLTNNRNLSYVPGGSLNGAFARMLFGFSRDAADVKALLTQLGIDGDVVLTPPKVSSTTENVAAPLPSALINSGIDPELKRSAYLRAAFRNLFITANGYIGLVDDIAQVDDKVCILSGGKVPYILRKAAEVVQLDGVDHPTYRFLCDAYVEGLMHGEGIDLVKNKGNPAEKILIL